jgi:hypothetical protein
VCAVKIKIVKDAEMMVVRIRNGVKILIVVKQKD